MNIQHLAIATVPMQSWGQIYDSPEALKKGTIFQDLDMPFFAADGDNPCCNRSCATDGELQEREKKMLQIYQACFVVDDLRLYLDTHPQDSQALCLLKANLTRKKELLGEFSQKYFPLTMDCMAEACETGRSDGCYCWQEGPMPWEGACV